ncbi:uncharacterized protein C18orf63 homolog isoform X2 [Hyperolius riggenbachi]
MDVKMTESLWFMDLPDLKGLCAVKIILNSGTLQPCIRDAQIKLCRKILFLYDQIVASPDPEHFDQILVIMAICFYKTGKIQAVAEKHATKIESPERVSPTQLEVCLSYTLIARLAPLWNKAGHLLIQGADFLAKPGKQDAVDMQIKVSDTQICICIRVQKVCLPPFKLLDLNVATGTLQHFLNDPSHVIERHFIPSNWCYVLPSMKMGQIISISHSIPLESPFQTYEELRTHWNMLYGYKLPIEPEEKLIFCNVYFKLIGDTLFTYPLSCLRSQPMQFYPRVDMAKLLDAFFSDLKSAMPHLCGFPVLITEKPLFPTRELTRPLSQGNPGLLNVTATTKLTSGSLCQYSGCSAESNQSMAPIKQSPQLHSAERAPASSHRSSVTSPSALFDFQNCLSATVPQKHGQKYVPVFHKKTVNINTNHVQLTAQGACMITAGITQALEERNRSNSLAVSSVNITANRSRPPVAQMAFTKESLVTHSLHTMCNNALLSKIHGTTQNPGPYTTFKKQLPVCQAHVKATSDSNPNSAKHLLHKSDAFQVKVVRTVTSGISHKRKKQENSAENIITTSTGCLTPEVSAKPEFHLNPKKCRPKQIKEVDVEMHARNNELHKVNNATLQNWLKQHGISTKSRDRKEQLVTEIIRFLQKD